MVSKKYKSIQNERAVTRIFERQCNPSWPKNYNGCWLSSFKLRISPSVSPMQRLSLLFYKYRRLEAKTDSYIHCCRHSRRLLEYMEDKFLSQVIGSFTRGGAILDVLVTNARELIGDAKTGGSLGCSDHAVMGFTVLRKMSQAKSKVRTLHFRKANFELFKELGNRTPWETALRDKGTEHSWQIFKDVFHRVQELSIPRCKKSGKEGKRPAWLSRDLLVKLKGKKELQDGD